MAKRGPDEIDLVCQEWAKSRRKQLGMDDPRMEKAASREFVGAIRSTLGQRRDLHAGARTNITDVHQPEGFYTGTALAVHQAFKRLNPFQQSVMQVQYVLKAKALQRADLMAMDVVTFYRHLGLVKGIVWGWVLRSDAFDNYRAG